MQLIQLETKIAAPVERCFLLSLSIDLHMQSTSQTGEKAIAGVMHGTIGPGESVTWRGRHFGIWWTHESVITRYERPHHFQDVMTRGAFRSFEHDHYFYAMPDGGTLMRDELRFASPLGWAGALADSLVLKGYLKKFLLQRNEVIQRAAEGPESGWRGFIGA